MSHGAVVADAARRLPRQGAAGVQLPDPGPLVAAALPLRPGARLRLEVHAAAGARQPRRHRGDPVVARRRAVKVSYPRKRYWNEPTLTAWERAYLPEIMRGLAVTSTVFLRNMWRWITRQEGRAHDLLPGGEARRLRAPQPRQAHPDAAPRRQAAVHRLQHVRDGVPGQGDRDRGRLRPTDVAAPQVPDPLRDRLLALRLLRPVRRGLPGGRDPHGARDARPAVRRPPPDVARPRGDADLAAAARRRQALSRRPAARQRAGGPP